MTSHFVLNIHKNFAHKMKETGFNDQAITSHLQEMLLDEDDIKLIVEQLGAEPCPAEQTRKQRR